LTFLRDPVPRFLSGVAQVLKLRVWHKRLHPCYQHNTTEELLDCILFKLETTEPQSFLEMHLAPQSFELYKQVMGFDISIEVMDLSELNNVMKALGAAAGTNDDVPTKGKAERSTTGSLIRRFPQFRLTPDVLTSQMIPRICNLYQADVVMLKQVGVTTTVCP
jgi:hypothetical protein